jgi:hypothetical protein
MPYSVTYPNRDPRYEHDKSAYDAEMKLLDRAVELLANGDSLARAKPAVRELAAVLENLDAIGGLARLVDGLGDDVDLSKGWLRSEVLKMLEGIDPTRDASSEDFLGGA